MNKRLYVEKKPLFESEKKALFETLKKDYGISLPKLRYINIYDLFNIDESLLEKAKDTIFAEKSTDTILDTVDLSKPYLAYEYLPGQFDQRADSAQQCLSLIDPNHKVKVKSGTLILFEQEVSEKDQEIIRHHLINVVEAQKKDLTQLSLLESPAPNKVKTINDFIIMTESELIELINKYGLAMSLTDLSYIQQYFKQEENRNPTISELKMLDTYWSDHCRHTTFETHLDKITFGNSPLQKKIEETFSTYLAMRKEVKRDYKPITLMDMATINRFYELEKGNLNDLEQSDENNACTIEIDVDNNGNIEKWLLLFKNETHNHPTEIEPFGGASTCIGGAIRDPLSGRAYVYQATRISGAGDIRAPISETLNGKLPQVTISKEAAKGYSSYGNQIGLATTHVKEFYHPGYIAKRLELGAVVGAVKKADVRKEKPIDGDLIILLGGKTGRDGIGGATGSSKAHHSNALSISAAEVQKGNAPEERKIQRLFRNPNVTRLIKKCNDFGAGGVAVAVGELADSLDIYLDLVPLKYQGLDATEIAISESQERMAVVVSKDDAKTFIDYANSENLEATIVAKVTNSGRLVMYYKQDKVVDISRAFINSNGVTQHAKVEINDASLNLNFELPLSKETFLEHLGKLNVASQKGLVEMFDSTVGATTVFMPYGGKKQLTETQVSVHKIPHLDGDTTTCSLMSYGFNPALTLNSPYHGGVYAVVEALTKIVATGADYKKVRFTCQEYFHRLNQDEKRWGQPVAALLGSIYALKEFNLASIGGKDSMSGSYGKLDVPPTFVAFAVTTSNSEILISPEFKEVGSYIYLVNTSYDELNLPNIDELKNNFDYVNSKIIDKTIISSYALTQGGLIEALVKMSYGNNLGFKVKTDKPIFSYQYGKLVVESKQLLEHPNLCYLGTTTNDDLVINGVVISKEEALEASLATFKNIYPLIANKSELDIIPYPVNKELPTIKANKTKIVKVVIPIFPGTNCEYDTYRAFKKEGAEVSFAIFNNLNSDTIQSSIELLANKIAESHILVLAGGFSAGDEPAGSGKFIANVLMQEKVKKAIDDLLARNGLILGICNGFQALVKSGLLPNVNLGILTENHATLAKNDINRHISTIKKTRVSSIKSPWLSNFSPGEIHDIVLSHGEGKFVINQEDADKLFANGQVAFQYVDDEGNPTMDPRYNPNGSYYAIEGITSPCGKILGKMGHSERYQKGLYKNIPNIREQNIFINAINYFKGE